MPELSYYTSLIVKQRDKRKAEFSSMATQLKKIKSLIDFITSLNANDIWSRVIKKTQDSELWVNICEKADIINHAIMPFVSENGLFTIAKGRIDRDYVNVGAIGITREGKSEFTATTTNLDQWVLPRRGGKPCTTSPVNVINGDSKDGKSKIIRVYYNSVAEMAALFHTFLIELGDKNDETDLLKVSTRKQLERWIVGNRTRIDNDTTIGKGNLGSKKMTFFEYLDNFAKYKERLRESDSDREFKDYKISDVEHGNKLETAKEYYSSVSYFADPNSKEKLFTSFATKRAEIYTTFEIDGEYVTNLQFLDTPGIGEQKPGLKSILSEAITTQLDVILIIRAVNPNKTNTSDLEDLLDSVRSRLSGKSHANESIYFVLNMWESDEVQAKYEDGEDERKFIINRLKQLQDTDSISLSEDHFRMIRVPSQVELLKNGETNDENPIGNYLKTIFNSIIPNIEKIDTGFCESALIQYNFINSLYTELLSFVSILSSHLPKNDISSKVNDILKTVGNAWRKANAKLKDDAIIGNIHYEIEEFCDSPTGLVLGDFFNAQTDGIKDFDAENNNFDFIKNFCEENEDAILEQYDKGGWVAFDDFTLYTELKKKFRLKLINAVYDRIDAEKAQKALDAEKVKLAGYFMKEGRLSYFEADPSKWWHAIADAIQSMNYPPLRVDKNGRSEYLYEIFQDFANFSIDYRKILSKRILQTLELCMHSDNFGNDSDNYNFVSHKSAIKAIIHSLLCIEACAQAQIKQDVIESELNSIMTEFRKVLNRLREVNIYGQQQTLTEERAQWEMFYKDYANVLFADDDTEKEQALVTQWKRYNN